MHIFNQLKRDHDQLRALLRRMESTTARAVRTRAELLREIMDIWTAHERAEETALYRVILDEPGVDGRLSDQALEFIEEHKAADEAMAELEETDPSQAGWIERFQILKTSLEHHFEEEEKDFFKNARRIVGRDNAEELGDLFEEIKAQEFKETGIGNARSRLRS